MKESYSKKYLRAIAAFAQAIYDSGYFLRFEGSIDWSDPWMQFCESPLKDIAKTVESTLDYELSWNQCCNAINWVFKYRPAEWAHLLEG